MNVKLRKAHFIKFFFNNNTRSMSIKKCQEKMSARNSILMKYLIYEHQKFIGPRRNIGFSS